MGPKRLWGLVTVCAVMLLAPAVWARDAKPGFFLHNGDRVVFYGDSITEQQMYGRDIETYVATRYPKMHVTFLNSGWSGDKVSGGGGGPIDVRLNRDVLPYKPTVVTILLGMNDGDYTSFNQGIFQTYEQGMTRIVDVLTQKLPGVRLTLLTPTFFDYGAKTRQPPPAGQGYNYVAPAPDYNQTLLRYGAFLKHFGAQHHILVVDMNTFMEAATQTSRSKDPTFSLFGSGLTGDGVHPDEVGHLIMASEVLTAWNAPGTVASVTLRPGRPVTATDPLPWPIPDAAAPAFSVSPLPGLLDVFRAYGSHLKSQASYRLTVDGADVGTFTAAQLGTGVDLTQFPGLPQNRQAQQVLDLVNQRVYAWHDFFKGSHGVATASDVPTVVETATLKAEDYALNRLRVQEYDAAQPKPHTFELLPAPVISLPAGLKPGVLF